jgi:hypothetical protein
MTGEICPNCGGLWNRLYESEHGPVCKYCLRDYDARGHDHDNAIPRPQ